jgi:hypothetical protein
MRLPHPVWHGLALTLLLTVIAVMWLGALAPVAINTTIIVGYTLTRA